MEANQLFDPDRDPEREQAELRARQEFEARARRDTGMERVDNATPDEWKDQAREFLRDYLENHPTMFPDDLWIAGLPKPPSPRALGPVIQRARREGWVEPSGEYRPSVSSNMSPKQVWRSRLWQPHAT